MNFNVGDTYGGYGKLTRVTDHYLWFGKKKALKKCFGKKSLTPFFKEAPDTIVDWKDPTAVTEYYNIFAQWKGVIRIGDSKTRRVFEVKNNMVFFEGEYYLPYYSSHIKETEKKFLKDGYIFGFCHKMYNAFWGLSQTTNTVNVFVVDMELTKEMYDYGTNKINKYGKFLKKEITLYDYLNCLDFSHINSTDLTLLKNNYHLLLEENLLPHTYGTGNKSVSFFFDKTFNDIKMSYRNRTGTLVIDNGYYGPHPFGNDYYAIVKIRPHFTNVAAAYIQVDLRKGSFNKFLLNSLSSSLVTIWDRAIEQNWKNWG